MSWNSKEVKAKVFNFCELMKIPLKIPNFQRPYEWEKERVEQFLEDIIEIYQKYGKDDDFQYLIGSMVFYEILDNPNQNSDSNNVDCKNSENLNSKILEIVDGQQRLITLGLILYILGEENNKLVDLELEQSQKELSQKRIKENYEIVKNALRNFKDKDKKDLKDFIIKNLIITALITHDLDLAFFLFDAQNTRGKELTKKDLLKVHHIRFVDDEEYEEKRYLAKKWEYYESYKESENDKPKDKLNEILQYIGIARKGVRRELDPIDLIEVDVYKEFLSEDEEYKLNNYNQPPLFESFEYNPENNEIIFFTRNIPIKIPLGNIRDGWRYIPFEIPQSIEGGKRFFYFVIKYFNLYRELEEKHRDIFNVLDTTTDTGNTYIRRIYKPLLLLYYDKFGENELKEYALRLLIILTYFRLIKSQIYNKTVVYSFSNKNGAKPESDDNFKGIDLFNLIFLSYSSKIVIEKLERYIKFEVSDILKDKSDKDKEKKVNLFVESMELGNNKNKNTKKQFINAWKNNFENEIKEVLKQCYRDWGQKMSKTNNELCKEEEKELKKKELEKGNVIEVSYNQLGNYIFKIPIYQRKYAWKPEDVEVLLNDLADENQENYFLGNIVVELKDKKENGKPILEVIDGQQRLTTLYLISAVLNNNKPPFNIDYEIRKDDREFLEKIENFIKINEKGNENNSLPKNPSIEFKENIETIRNWLNRNGNKNINLQKIYFTITAIPEKTEVAKFFEVMNSRGKQLEHHQVLKARFLEILKDDNSCDYAKIWDFCSDFNHYLEDLIYYNLSGKESINKLREDSIKFVESGNFTDKLKTIFKQDRENNQNNGKIPIKSLLNEDKSEEKTYNKIPEDKEVNSPIKFPVFLLHTLRLFLENNENYNDTYKKSYISLDDKKLLETFGAGQNRELWFKGENEEERKKISKDFILFLLKMRILFDYFIFKRQENKTKDEETIKLKRLKRIEDGYELGNTDNKLINLQLLFYNTSPQTHQQEWISPALNWLYKNITESINNKFYEDFIEFLEKINQNIAIERLKEKSNLRRIFNEFIKYENISDTEDLDDLENKLNEKLNKGTDTEHYWFYLTDYLLWKEFRRCLDSNGKFNCSDENNIWSGFNPENLVESDKVKELIGNIKNFRLTRKNSIEHIQPQSKTNDEWTSAIKEKEINCEEVFKQNKCNIDCFGNLALISSHMNSKLSNQNFDFSGKKTEIKKQILSGTIESLKMLLVYGKYGEWNSENCKRHHNKIIDLLKKSI